MKFTPRGLLAGLVYLIWLAHLQAKPGLLQPVHCCGSAARGPCIVPALRQRNVPRSVPLAMLVAGLAVTIKTTAFFEAAFLGLCCVVTYWRSGVRGKRLLSTPAQWAAIGAAPTMLIAAGYWVLGHWHEYWHAMYVSNLTKTPDWPTAWVRLRIMALVLVPVLLLAALRLAGLKTEGRRLVIPWLAAALARLAAVPNFHLHYGLPLLVPL